MGSFQSRKFLILGFILAAKCALAKEPPFYIPLPPQTYPFGLKRYITEEKEAIVEKSRDMASDQGYVDFVFEMGMLANISRAGNAFLGSGDQTVAEHSFRCAVIGYLLSKITTLSHDRYKLLCMCLFHDAHETRIGDLNYLQQGYLSVDTDQVWADIENLSLLGREVRSLHNEFEEKESNESLLAKDADKLELLFFLKEQHDLGNPRALEWFTNAEKKLLTAEAKSLAQELKERKADEWWKMRFSKQRPIRRE
ncbi:MAG: HD domain-containing protein [Rhabdochlamydiaceae bacterium]